MLVMDDLLCQSKKYCSFELWKIETIHFYKLATISL